MSHTTLGNDLDPRGPSRSAPRPRVDEHGRADDARPATRSPCLHRVDGLAGPEDARDGLGSRHDRVRPMRRRAHLRRAGPCRTRTSPDSTASGAGSTRPASPSTSRLPSVHSPTLELDALDLVLIDGSHSFPQVFIDWYYTQSALKVGGALLVDDVHIWTGKCSVTSSSWSRSGGSLSGGRGARSRSGRCPRGGTCPRTGPTSCS